jgi:ATP:cob(I)alamin adenosyltransferase
VPIRTGKGDTGCTCLRSCSGVRKDDPYIILLGDIDELNAVLSIVCLKSSSKSITGRIGDIQGTLDKIGSLISLEPGKRARNDVAAVKSRSLRLERYLKRADNGCTKGFIKRHKSEEAAFLNLARVVARRAERGTTTLKDYEGGSCEPYIKYFNILSDCLFVMSAAKA